MRCRQRKELGGGEELLFLVINLASSAARRVFLPPSYSQGLVVLGLVLRTAEAEENFFPALSPPEADRKFSLPPLLQLLPQEEEEGKREKQWN